MGNNRISANSPYRRMDNIRKNASALLLIVLVSLSILASTSMLQVDGAITADEWPTFGYDLSGNRYSPSTVPVTNQVSWSQAAANASDAIVADGKVFTGGGRNNTVYCLNAVTGEVIWKYVTSTYTEVPAYADGKLFLGVGSYSLYCLDASTSNLLWSFAANDTGTIYGCPLISNGKVYTVTSHGTVYCLNSTTGKALWYKQPDSRGAYGSTMALSEGIIYYDSVRTFALNATNGNTVWNGNVSCEYASPVVVDGKLYTGANDNKMYCLDAKTGTQIWSYTTGGIIGSSPVIAYGKVYVGAWDGNLYCLDAASGAKLWNVSARIADSPAVADGKVVFGSNDYKVYCLDATTGATLWSYQANSYLTSPTIAYGAIYISSKENIYCFGTASAPTPTPTPTPAPNSAPATQWTKSYSAPDTTDYAGNAIIKTNDGGYAMAGISISYLTGTIYNEKFHFLKTDAFGNKELSYDYTVIGVRAKANDIVQTSDGGYAIVGFRATGIVYDYSSFAKGYSIGYYTGVDICLLKISANGQTQWIKYIGNNDSNEAGYALTETSDGGFAITGLTQQANGTEDMLVVKTDADGNVQWNQMYGLSGNDCGKSIITCPEGGYALTGYTQSPSSSGYYYVLLKIDNSGTPQWSSTFGTPNSFPESLIQTQDGGYAIIGYTNVTNTGNDFYIVKTNSAGVESWNKKLGTANNDYGYSIIQTSDGYAMAGWTAGTDDNALLVKTDLSGNLVWSNTYGGTSDVHVYAVGQDADGGYYLGGEIRTWVIISSSPTGGNVYFDDYDFWMTKTASDGSVPIPEFGFWTLQLAAAIGIVCAVAGITLSKRKDKP